MDTDMAEVPLEDRVESLIEYALCDLKNAQLKDVELDPYGVRIDVANAIMRLKSFWYEKERTVFTEK